MDRSFWTSLIPVAAALIAVVGTLIAASINARFQQRQFEERQRTERERFEEQLNMQRLQFDREANEALFTDILNRFSSEMPLHRASAAIRLARAAKKPWPGMPTDLAPNNYPFFSDAASQLCIALQMEESGAVRGEVVQALREMTEFARDKDQKLLNLQIEHLARANRRAKRTFLDELARLVAVCTAPEEQEVQAADAIPQAKAFLERLAVLSPFCLEGWGSPSSKTLISLTDTVLCLLDLMSSAEFQDAIALYRQLLISPRVDSEEQSEKVLLQDVQSCAARLIDTRTALSDSLLALKTPSGFPTDDAALKKWERDPALNLSGCFLSGANLKQVHLEGADLSAILLHSAVLYGAQLAGAQLKSAQLQRATLYDVDLKSACLEGAQMKGATLEHSRLNGSSCDGADLQDANCHDAHFEGASLRYALLQGATFLAANLTETKLSGVTFEDEDGRTSRRANFGSYGPGSFSFEDHYKKGHDPERRETEWWRADFSRFDPRVKDSFAGDPAMEFVASVAFQGPPVDERAIEWLQANYPTSNENYNALMQRYESTRPKTPVDGAPSVAAHEPTEQSMKFDSHK